MGTVILILLSIICFFVMGFALRDEDRERGRLIFTIFGILATLFFSFGLISYEKNEEVVSKIINDYNSGKIEKVQENTKIVYSYKK